MIFSSSGVLRLARLCGAAIALWATPVVSAQIPAPGDEISSPLQLAPWVAQFARVATADTLFSQFREERYFPMKKAPSLLQGEMRFSRDRGLSLAYTAPQAQMMILDDVGLLLRDAKGRQKALAGDAKSAGLAQALSAVMEFDWEEMQDQFILRGARADGTWRLDLEPREANSRARLGVLTLWGEGDFVQRLQLTKTASQRVVVTILNREFNRAFTPQELKRYFR